MALYIIFIYYIIQCNTLISRDGLMRGNKITVSVARACLFLIGFWKVILLNGSLIHFRFFKPQSFGCTIRQTVFGF